MPGGDCHDFRFLNLVRERVNGRTLKFRLAVSKTERPAVMEIGDVIFYPETFDDAREAKRLYYSINSFHDFERERRAAERNRSRGNFVPLGGGDDDIMVEQPDNYDDL